MNISISEKFGSESLYFLNVIWNKSNPIPAVPQMEWSSGEAGAGSCFQITLFLCEFIRSFCFSWHRIYPDSKWEVSSLSYFALICKYNFSTHRTSYWIFHQERIASAENLFFRLSFSQLGRQRSCFLLDFLLCFVDFVSNMITDPYAPFSCYWGIPLAQAYWKCQRPVPGSLSCQHSSFVYCLLHCSHCYEQLSTASFSISLSTYRPQLFTDSVIFVIVCYRFFINSYSHSLTNLLVCIQVDFVIWFGFGLEHSFGGSGRQDLWLQEVLDGSFGFSFGYSANFITDD